MKYIIAVITAIIIISFVIVLEVILARQGVTQEFKNPSSLPLQFGTSGKKLNYLILGDSTTAGQGGDYDNGIALSSARFLSTDYRVEMINLSVSGAKVGDVNREQLPRIAGFKPDLILIAAGANDVTKLSSLEQLRNHLDTLITGLIAKNCQAKIVLTGVPAMGTIPRFLQPLKSIVGWRGERLNTVFDDIIATYNLTSAPIAVKTGPIFAANPELFASDKFHPDNDGYRVWIDVINPALADALVMQPSHCTEN